MKSENLILTTIFSLAAILVICQDLVIEIPKESFEVDHEVGLVVASAM